MKIRFPSFHDGIDILEKKSKRLDKLKTLAEWNVTINPQHVVEANILSEMYPKLIFGCAVD